MNTSAWHRPFDDVTSERVRREADAVANLLAAAEEKRAELVSSAYLDFEVSQNPNLEVRNRIMHLLSSCRIRVQMSTRVVERARQLESSGLRGLDALLVAAAEAANVDALVTTDDRMLARARRAGAAVHVPVVLPPTAVQMLAGGER